MPFGFSLGGGAEKNTQTRKLGAIDWDELRKILNLDVEYNRPDRMGPFGGWQYDPETNTQRFVATDPGMQAAQERMSRRLAGEGFTPYEPPAQISSMTDALMATRMERMGLLDENSRPNLAQENYGTPFGDRQGGAYRNAMRPSPFEMPPPQQAPPQQGGQPPQGGTPPNQQPPGPDNPRWRPPWAGIGRPPYSIP